MLKSPPRLSSRQTALIREYARTVPAIAREQFVHRVMRHIGDDPTDHVVMHVINLSLDCVPFFYPPSPEQTK